MTRIASQTEHVNHDSVGVSGMCVCAVNQKENKLKLLIDFGHPSLRGCKYIIGHLLFSIHATQGRPRFVVVVVVIVGGGGFSSAVDLERLRCRDENVICPRTYSIKTSHRLKWRRQLKWYSGPCRYAHVPADPNWCVEPFTHRTARSRARAITHASQFTKPNQTNFYFFSLISIPHCGPFIVPANQDWHIP